MTAETAKDKIFEVLRDTKNPALEQISFRRVMMLAEEIADALPMAKIPESVSEEIKENRDESLSNEFEFANLNAFENKAMGDWITNHQETFARAWIDGVWIVHETGEVVRV